MDQVAGGAGFLVLLAAWLIPIAVISYVLRALHTIIQGMRSINAAAQRTAETLERMERRDDGGATAPPATR